MSRQVDSTPLRVAVIGTGFIGTVHVEAARRARAHVVGILGSSVKRAIPKARELVVPIVFDSLEELAQSPDVDLVHVTSPNYLHAPQVLALLQGGKHVICEKPLALTAEQGAELVAEAVTRNLVNATCFNIRFYPLMRQAQVMVANNQIGSVLFSTGSYHQDWLLLDTDWNWRLERDQAGTMRAVADIGSHWIDLVGWVSGSPVSSVMADLYTAIPVRRRPTGPIETFSISGTDTDLIEVNVTNEDAASIMFVCENGARGSFSVSQISAGKKNNLEFEIAGSSGSLNWKSSNPDELLVGRRGAPNDLIFRDPSLMDASAAASSFYPAGHVEGFGETFRGLFESVYRDAKAGQPAAHPMYPTFADGLAGLEVADSIWKSNESKQWIQVERNTQ